MKPSMPNGTAVNLKNMCSHHQSRHVTIDWRPTTTQEEQGRHNSYRLLKLLKCIIQWTDACATYTAEQLLSIYSNMRINIDMIMYIAIHSTTTTESQWLGRDLQMFLFVQSHVENLLKLKAVTWASDEAIRLCVYCTELLSRRIFFQCRPPHG